MGTVPAEATKKTWLVNGKPSGFMVTRELASHFTYTHDHEVALYKGMPVAKLESMLPIDAALIPEGARRAYGRPPKKVVDQSESSLSQKQKEHTFFSGQSTMISLHMNSKTLVKPAKFNTW